MPEVPAETRAYLRETRALMGRYRAIPAGEFPGHKTIALANLEAVLGCYTITLLDALEEAEEALLDAQVAP